MDIIIQNTILEPYDEMYIIIEYNSAGSVTTIPDECTEVA